MNRICRILKDGQDQLDLVFILSVLFILS